MDPSFEDDLEQERRLVDENLQMRVGEERRRVGSTPQQPEATQPVPSQPEQPVDQEAEDLRNAEIREAAYERSKNQILPDFFSEDSIYRKTADITGEGVVQAVGDFIETFGGPLSGLGTKLNETFVPERNKQETFARDIAALVIPALMTGPVVGSASKAANARFALPGTVNKLGKIGAEVGIDTAIAYSARTSEEDENLSETLQDLTGVPMPFATGPDMTGEQRRKMHAMEAAGIAAVPTLFRAGIKLFNQTRRSIVGIGKRSQGIVDDLPKWDFDSPVETAIEQAEDEVLQVFKSEQTDQIAKQVAKGPNQTSYVEYDLQEIYSDGFNPFIHKGGTKQETYVPGAGANAVEAKADIADSIYTPGYSPSARAAPAATEAFQKNFMGIADGTERADALAQLFDTLAPSIRVVNSANKNISPKQINNAVDELVDLLHNTDVSFSEFREIVDSMKVNVYDSQRFLDRKNHQILANSFRKSFLQFYDPNGIRASTVLMNQAAGEVQDIAKGISMSEGRAMFRQNELLMNKLQLVASENRAYQYAAGNALNYSNVRKLEGEEAAAKFLEANQTDWEKFYVTVADEGRQTVNSWAKISSENPEYLKVFAEAVDATSSLSKKNQVDTLDKLKAYLDKNISVLAAFGQDREVPSWFISGLTGVRYNAMLSGGAAFNAMEGNITGLALKPLTTTLGAAAQLDGGKLSEAIITFSGFSENFKRAAKHMFSEYDYAVKNPEMAMMKGRQDLIQKHLDNFNIMEEASQIWKENGQVGKVFMWNISKGLYAFNKNPYVRYGINAMYALDGFVQSMVMSGNARMKAYRELGDRSLYASKKDWLEAFNNKQREIYSQYFDSKGALKQDLPSAVNYQSKELAFNLDDELASKIGNMTDRIPIAKALFSFPRTGINALKYLWSHTPIGGAFAIASGKNKMGKVFRAKSLEEKVEALKMHGIIEENADDISRTFDALKSEYIGRQLVGGTVVTLGGMWALEGNLRGNGPTDGGERKKLEALGWKARTIKNPFTGKWVSYENIEPFSSILATMGDIVYFGNRVDQDISEGWFQKLASALVVGPTNNTFLSSMRPLAKLLTFDEGAWELFAAGTMTSMVPYSGLLSSFNRVVAPQLKDVDNEITEYVKNRYKFLFQDNSGLQDLLDVYTGNRINHTDPLNAALQEVLPFFRTNFGEEEWRFKLIESGWKGMPAYNTNPFTGQPLTSQERFYVNNWVAKNYVDQNGKSLLVSQIEELFDPNTEKGGLAMQSLEMYRANRGNKSQRDFPIKNIYLHDELDAIHREAYQLAFNDLQTKYEEYSDIGQLRVMIKQAQERGQVQQAAELADTMKSVQDNLSEKIKQDPTLTSN